MADREDEDRRERKKERRKSRKGKKRMGKSEKGLGGDLDRSAKKEKNGGQLWILWLCTNHLIRSVRGLIGGKKESSIRPLLSSQEQEQTSPHKTHT